MRNDAPESVEPIGETEGLRPMLPLERSRANLPRGIRGDGTACANGRPSRRAASGLQLGLDAL